jgi:excinuclease ABC subunit A
MKLARELSKRQTGRTLYLLDEPTTGLHFDDVRKLLEVLHRLADLGNSVIIIEHNLDVIRNADWILDLGPEGGENGGRIVGQGRPARIAATPGSFTGQFLTRYYASSNGKLAAVDPEDEAASEDGSALTDEAGVEGAGSPVSRVSEREPAPAKTKRARRNTPAEDDLASTRAKANRRAEIEANPKPSGPRQKKTGRA